MAAIRSAYRQKALATHLTRTRAARSRPRRTSARSSRPSSCSTMRGARRSTEPAAAARAARREVASVGHAELVREDVMPPRMTAGWRRVVRVTSLAMLRNVALGDDGTVELPTIVGLFEPGAREEACSTCTSRTVPPRQGGRALRELVGARAVRRRDALVGRRPLPQREPLPVGRVAARGRPAQRRGRRRPRRARRADDDRGVPGLWVRAAPGARDRRERARPRRARFTAAPRHGLEERPASATGAPLAPGAVLGPFVVYAASASRARRGRARRRAVRGGLAAVGARARRGGVEEFEVRAERAPTAASASWARRRVRGEPARRCSRPAPAARRTRGRAGGRRAVGRSTGAQRERAARGALRDEAAASAELRGGCGA